MFGLFKKKQESAMDGLIHAVYGNPPPPKRADVSMATGLAWEALLLKNVSRNDVAQLAASLYSGPIPYSTEDLALSVSLAFFKMPERMPSLREAQLAARMQALEWFNEGKVARLIISSFEDTLYVLYKPLMR